MGRGWMWPSAPGLLQSPSPRWWPSGHPLGEASSSPMPSWLIRAAPGRGPVGTSRGSWLNGSAYLNVGSPRAGAVTGWVPWAGPVGQSGAFTPKAARATGEWAPHGAQTPNSCTVGWDVQWDAWCDVRHRATSICEHAGCPLRWGQAPQATRVLGRRRCL